MRYQRYLLRLLLSVVVVGMLASVVLAEGVVPIVDPVQVGSEQ